MNGWSCSPKHGRTHFTVLKNFFPHDGIKFLKTFKLVAGSCSPKHGPVFLNGVEVHFRVDVMHPCKNIQVYGWAVLPNIFCHGPAHFAALKTRFVLLLCRHSTTFKKTAGRAPPITVPLISRCWRLYLSGWYETFQKHSNLWLGSAPPNTAQLFSRCWRTISSGC